MNKKITLSEIKQALKDSRFRQKLPQHFQSEVTKFLSNPNCGCNAPLYRKIVSECGHILSDYFPDKEVNKETIEEIKKDEGSWTVINCHINELENNLRKIKHAKVNIAIARYEDEVTVVVQEI